MVAPSIWDALRGEAPTLPWLRHVPCHHLLPLESYVAPSAIARTCRQLPRLMGERPMQMLIVRGASQNGRKTLVGAVARALGKGLLVASEAVLEDESRWRLFGALAVTLDALPLIEVALSAGEIAACRRFRWWPGRSPSSRAHMAGSRLTAVMRCFVSPCHCRMSNAGAPTGAPPCRLRAITCSTSSHNRFG